MGFLLVVLFAFVALADESWKDKFHKKIKRVCRSDDETDTHTDCKACDECLSELSENENDPDCFSLCKQILKSEDDSEESSEDNSSVEKKKKKKKKKKMYRGRKEKKEMDDSDESETDEDESSEIVKTKKVIKQKERSMLIKRKVNLIKWKITKTLKQTKMNLRKRHKVRKGIQKLKQKKADQMEGKIVKMKNN